MPFCGWRIIILTTKTLPSTVQLCNSCLRMVSQLASRWWRMTMRRIRMMPALRQLAQMMRKRQVGSHKCQEASCLCQSASRKTRKQFGQLSMDRIHWLGHHYLGSALTSSKPQAWQPWLSLPCSHMEGVTPPTLVGKGQCPWLTPSSIWWSMLSKRARESTTGDSPHMLAFPTGP